MHSINPSQIRATKPASPIHQTALGKILLPGLWISRRMGLWIQAMQDPSGLQDDDLRWGVQYPISNTE
ncbi:hypothetical protein ACFSVN_06310 [Gracilimonas halophila]|uniref:Uncharacterized protein n=1 Tax=Gracilimonas halophila TaxID=1834464 RepID=A0ABW5JIY7_9BACT